MLQKSLASIFVAVFLAVNANAQLFQGEHAPCNICGTTGLAVSIPLASIGDFEGINFGNCMTLSAAAQNGFISPAQCLLLQSTTELKENCGCNEPQTTDLAPKGKTPTVEVVGPPTIAPGANPVCYVCGSETAQATKPDAIIEVPPELNSPLPAVPCGTIVGAGLNQLIPESACQLARETPQFAEVCGCVEPAPPTLPPMLQPTGFPTEAPENSLVNDEPIAMAEPKAGSTETTTPTFSPEAETDNQAESEAFRSLLSQAIAVSAGAFLFVH